MTGRRQGWLEAVALHFAGGRTGSARTLEGGSAAGDERFSRAVALRLALVGAASLSLGLWKASPAAAQDRGDCFAQCLEDHDKELKRRLQSCNDVFRGYRRTPPGSWARIKYIFPFGRLIAHDTLAALCHRAAADELRGAKNDCYEGCETTCREQRSVQSASGRSVAACEVTPPPKAPPPTIPPIPSHPPSEACAACNQNGDKCCGSCPGNPLAAACVGVSEGEAVVDCATALATFC